MACQGPQEGCQDEPGSPGRARPSQAFRRRQGEQDDPQAESRQLDQAVGVLSLRKEKQGDRRRDEAEVQAWQKWFHEPLRKKSRASCMSRGTGAWKAIL